MNINEDYTQNFQKFLNVLMLCILLSILAVNTFGQAKNISKEQMINDIDLLFSTIEKVHPDMYFVYSKESLRKDIEEVKSQLEPSGDIFYFYKQVAPLIAKLGDAHTNIPPPYDEPSDLVNVLFFPLSVKVTYPAREIRVQNDYTQTQNTIPAGAQITSINKRPANDIVQEMLDYVSGEKDFFRISRLEVYFSHLIHSLYRDSIFDVQYVFNQEKHTIQVRGISCKDMYENPSHQSKSPYSLSILPDKDIGIIEFNHFVDIGRFKVFLDSTFRVLQREKIGNLIIDVRKNRGGTTGLGDELFQYISPVPFVQFHKVIVMISDILKQDRKYPSKVRNGISIVEYKKINKLKKNKLRYKGDVYLLTSHFTSSAASSFSWAFKYFKMGVVVGEETGGMSVGFASYINRQLPNSGLHYRISTAKFYSYGATDDNIHGTLPDYNVEAEKALDFTLTILLPPS